jgi:hypothetical protein
VKRWQQAIPRQRQSGRRGTRLGAFETFYCLALAGFLFTVLYQAREVYQTYWLEFLVLAFVGCLSIYGQLLSLQRQAAIHFGSFLFCYLFMSAAPIVQIGDDADAVFHMGNWAFWAALNALAFTLIGTFSIYRLRRPQERSLQASRFSPSNVNYAFLFGVALIAGLISVALFWSVLFTNRDLFAITSDEKFGDPTVSLMARFLLLSVPFFGALIGLRTSIANRKLVWIILFSLVLLLALVINNPLILPRYQLAGLAFFAIDYFFYGKKTKFLAIFLITGVLLAPLFQTFRHEDGSTGEELKESGLVGAPLLSMDYDAFRMSCYTMLTVENDGISWGSNLLGAGLFFIPRAVWSNKPLPTAWIIYATADHSAELGTSNLSTPLMAEGYFSFGWIGALAIAFFYWWGISKVTLLSGRDPDSWMFLLRSLFVGLVLIFLRGTLTVSVSAVAGQFAALAIPGFLIRYRFGSSTRYLPRNRVAPN